METFTIRDLRERTGELVRSSHAKERFELDVALRLLHQHRARWNEANCTGA